MTLSPLTPVSLSTGLKVVPGAMSVRLDEATGRRSNTFGATTIRGFLKFLNN